MTIVNYESRIKNVVMLKVYDIAGREVATLVNDIMPAGKHAVEFNARLPPVLLSNLKLNFGGQAADLSSGVYFYTLIAGVFEKTLRMVMVSLTVAGHSPECIGCNCFEFIRQ
jgi:hypothetical protein